MKIKPWSKKPFLLDRERLFQFVYPERLEKFRRVLDKRTPELTIVLENVSDPHNLSAALRSCDAVGIMEVNLVYYGGQAFPKIINESSASAGKWLNANRFNSVNDCFTALRKQNKKIYTTHLAKDAISIYDLDLSEPVALVFGNEHLGVSEEAYNLADGNFMIPQVGMVQSLNISVACAVSLYEAFRQRQAKGKYYDENTILSMLEKWVRRERNL